MLLAIVFLRTASRNESDTVFVASPELEIPASSPPPAATTDEKKVTPAPAQKVFPQFAHSKPGTVIRTQSRPDRRPRSKVPSPTTIALTEEEKYAYRQLMIALSVSSSKFKIVKDSINGNENIEHTNSTNER